MVKQQIYFGNVEILERIYRCQAATTIGGNFEAANIKRKAT
jgi:hypothetical protein